MNKLMNKQLKRRIHTFMTIKEMEKQLPKHIVWHFFNSKNDHEIQSMKNWQLKYLIDRLEVQNNLSGIASCAISVCSLILVWFNNIVGVDKDATIAALSRSASVHTDHQKTTYINTINFIRKHSASLFTDMFQVVSIITLVLIALTFIWNVGFKQTVRDKFLMEYYRRTENDSMSRI